ncbi:MAG: hypothetical protein WCD86_25725 [Ktedonobacteraceae bacterium]
MQKLNNYAEVSNRFGLHACLAADKVTGLAGNNDTNFWATREQCRITNGEYSPITIEGDDPLRFLHVSADDPNKVAYTKDADKGRADIQTRTTLSAYCEKFGLQEPVIACVARELQEDVVTTSAESDILRCMHQLENAIGRVDELKAHLRALLG